MNTSHLSDRVEPSLRSPGDMPVNTIIDEVALSIKALQANALSRRRRIVSGAQGPLLTVDGHQYLGFCSNDYLGLANHPALISAARMGLDQYGVGAGASALISGHNQVADELELALAAFVGAPRALHFSSGYMANVGIIPALVGSGDAVFSDSLNHACLIDGARLSNADIRVYDHGNLTQLEHLLKSDGGKRKLILSDGVFSMDGDIAPVPDLLSLCERYDALLLLDDAHGFGVLGTNGRGTLSHFSVCSPRLLYMGTLGKAAGVAGAFVAGDATLIEWLLQRARTYVFSTAQPPLLASATLAALELIRVYDLQRQHLSGLISQLRDGLAALPWHLLPSETPIQALIVKDSTLALTLMDSLCKRGFLVPAIRPPTVPAYTARLRISLSAAHTSEQVNRLVAALNDLVP